MASICPACSGRGADFATGRVLGRRAVTYRCCVECGTVFLPEPDWLDEAYSSAISSLDLGLLERNVQLANITTMIILAERLRGGRFLDFAGGYGTLTRMMRDRGFDFRHDDPMCENLFAQDFQAIAGQRYDLITAFEVLEHLADPAGVLRELAEVSPMLLVTTELVPQPTPAPSDWDYYSPETGQHITFYSRSGLTRLATRLGMKLTTTGHLIHLLHREPLRPATRLLLRDERFTYVLGAVTSEAVRRRGLIARDRAAAVERGHGSVN